MDIGIETFQVVTWDRAPATGIRGFEGLALSLEDGNPPVLHMQNSTHEVTVPLPGMTQLWAEAWDTESSLGTPSLVGFVYDPSTETVVVTVWINPNRTFDPDGEIHSESSEGIPLSAFAPLITKVA